MGRPDFQMTTYQELPPTVQRGILLAPLTWWKIGGPAEYFSQPRSLDQLMAALNWAHVQNLPVTVLGGGSNVLIPDEGLQGLVLSLRELKGSQSEIVPDPKGAGVEHLLVSAWAGTPKSDLTKLFLKHHLSPALFLCGLPGDLGGGVVMNAGVSEDIRPREFQEIVSWVEVAEAQKPLRRVEHDHIQWHYRQSQGWQPGVIVKVGLSWPMTPHPNLMAQVKAATRQRLQKQPLNWPSCGSVFKNPPGHKSGALIEQAGLKGFAIGQAQVSELHANFIINRGGATAKDVKDLIAHVQKTVRDKFSLDLVTEVRFL